MDKSTDPTQPKYKIEIYSGADKEAHAQDINAYYELRRKAFTEKWGKDQDTYYGKYPTEHDARDKTVFLIFKILDPESGSNVVFGGRRLVFPEEKAIGTLPLEGKHMITNRKKANRFASLANKNALNMDDIIPALKGEHTIHYAELGSFVIDQGLTHRLFSKDEYIQMREAIYETSLTAARNAGADIVVIGPGRANLKHQEDWLKLNGVYEFKHLGKTRDLFSNPLPKGDESEVLLINVSNRYTLSGHKSVLRYNQTAAQSARNSSR